MYRNSKSWIWRTIVFSIIFAAVGVARSESTTINVDIYSGYYSREQNDGELARTSGKSHYIRFYSENRVVRLIVPYPYSKTLNADTIRKVLDIAANKTIGSAYLSDTFGVLDEKVVAHLDSIRLIDDIYYYDCGVAVPCKIEFADKSMNIIQKGIVKEHVTAYDLVPDPPTDD